MPRTGRGRDVSDEAILDVFRQADDPVLITKEVAEKINLGRRGTFDRLDKLYEEGILMKKKVGETGAIWWFPDILEKKHPND